MHEIFSEKDNPRVSIIIRTKNEERWITLCLQAVNRQTYRSFEIILVDNNSTDRTVELAKLFDVKVVMIDVFKPGKAINDGIRASTGEILVFLSGHCVPVSDTWLESLVKDVNDRSVAGVYGRQQPLSFSSDFDKRDLLNVFGLDKKIQIKDSFFHNANSAVRREFWERFPFNEEVTNIEDRVWGYEVIKAGYKIVYEPDASVYHWHGIHQDLNPARARNIVRILENLQNFSSKDAILSPSEQKILAIIPVRGKSKFIGNKYLLEETIKCAKQSKYINEILVTTDCEETAELAQSLGAIVPFIRPAELSENFIDIQDVLHYSIMTLDKMGKLFNIAVILTENYPFRPKDVLDKMIYRFVSEGLDTLIAGVEEKRGMLLKKGSEIKIIEEGFMPRSLKETKSIVGMLGFGCISYLANLRERNIFGGKLGVYEIDNYLSTIEIKDESLDMYQRLRELIQGVMID
jgi:rhamnosyltransferase